MYIVINKTTNVNKVICGSFPDAYLEQLLNNGQEIIVISKYSDTIKIPVKMESYGEVYWDWIDYPLPTKELGI